MSFNPDDVAVANGNIFGFPYDEKVSDLIILPVPWEVTTSYGNGASLGPEAIRKASTQLDFVDSLLDSPWNYPVYMLPSDDYWQLQNLRLKKLAQQYIHELESGVSNTKHIEIIKEINKFSNELNNYIYDTAKNYFHRKKTLCLLGGDHSTPFGLIKFLSEIYDDLTVVQIDAHADLREAYEGFEFSHASIMYNVMHKTNVKHLVQIGIRDFSPGEKNLIETDNRITTFYDYDIKRQLFDGKTYAEIVENILKSIPTDNVYISFDIDGLSPDLCPNTGTPVPGGFTFFEIYYFLDRLALSGKHIVGFDLNEVSPGNNEWDANVGSRILFKLINIWRYSSIFAKKSNVEKTFEK